MARDSDFINRVISDLSKHDQFTSSLYEVYQITSQQNIALGIHRSDYLLHGDESIKQVELNTVASSFSSLSGLTTDLHQFLSTSTPLINIGTNFYNDLSSESIDILWRDIAPNTSFLDIPNALARAWKLYKSST